MLAYNTKPVPHTEAAKIISGKPTVSRDVFDALPSELQANAFLISGIEDFDTLQAIRDRIADLPAGGDWNAIKKDIIKEMSPWFNEQSADARAEILLRHHGSNAYAAAEKRVYDELSDIFTHYMYLTDGGPNIRASHAALNKLILPADHPFWDTHWGSWEWGCHCKQIGLMDDDVDEEKARDKTRPAHERRVLDESALDELKSGNLVRGSSSADVRTLREKNKAEGESGGYEYRAGDTGMNYDQIKGRWDDATRTDFETWADQQDVGDSSLLARLLGKITTGTAQVVSKHASLRKHPVSAALSTLYFWKKHRSIIDHSASAVDAVHDDGSLPHLVFKGSAGGHLGLYNGGLAHAPTIAISSAGDWPHLTTVHELGHFLDHHGFSSAVGFSSKKSKGKVSGVLATIKQSATYQDILKHVPDPHKYWLKDEELWARAYAQYISVRSGDKVLLSELGKARKSMAPWRQWPEKEFEPIAEMIDTVFEKLKWRTK